MVKVASFRAPSSKILADVCCSELNSKAHGNLATFKNSMAHETFDAK